MVYFLLRECYSLKIKQPFDSNHFREILLYTMSPWFLFLRKEVIQPHLPIRLPCYDFTPIIDPTGGGFLPNGLDHRLRVLPTFVV